VLLTNERPHRIAKLFGVAVAAGLLCPLPVLRGGQEPPAHEVTPPKDHAAVCRLRSSAVREASGLFKSRKHPGLFWTHNDSGNRASLFPIRLDGEVLAEWPLKDAVNTDWEDIAGDDAGNLYLGDIGDNARRYDTRVIYRCREPEDRPGRPGVPEGDRTIVVEERIEFRYADGPHDAEALVVYKGDLYVLTKEMLAGAGVYRIERSDDGTARGVLVCRIPAPMATAADISADGKLLAVSSYGQLWVFDVPPDMAELAKVRPKTVRFPPHFQIEGCAFDGLDVLLIEEKGSLWRITPEMVAAGSYLRLTR
jgi:hypothetical protein